LVWTVFCSLFFADYSLANPDTLTKYNNAASISQNVLTEVTKAAIPGATLLSLCQMGDELLEAETAKVYKGKKISKGLSLRECIHIS
jgi:methionine aminopeptidase